MSRGMSETQRLAVAFTREHGGSLVRLPGGFWTYPGCPTTTRSYGEVPDEYVRTSTVKSLIRLGVVDETEHRTSRTTTGAPSSFCVAVRLKDSRSTS